jgi:hypothetical protein
VRERHTSSYHFTMSTTSTTGQLASRLARIAHNWPADPFRPNMQLKKFMQSLSEHPNLSPAAVEAAQALEANVAMKKVRAPVLCRSTSLITYLMHSILSVHGRSSQRHHRTIMTALTKASRRQHKA